MLSVSSIWINYIRAMFAVYTEHPIEKTTLEEQHHSVNKHFHVSSHQTQTLINLIRSITFEFFRGSPSQLAKKLTRLTTDCLNFSLSLTLFRQAMELIKQYEQTLQLYENYFSELSSHLVQQKGGEIGSLEVKQPETSVLQQLAHYHQARVSKLINDTDIQQLLQHQLTQTRHASKIQKSWKNGLLKGAQNAFDTTVKEKLDLSHKKVLNCHNPKQTNHSWWKGDQKDEENKSDKNESNSLTEFNHRGASLMKQQTIQQLMKKDAKIEKELAGHISKQPVKPSQSTAKFMKKMKEKLITAKLNRRRRRL